MTPKRLTYKMQLMPPVTITQPDDVYRFRENNQDVYSLSLANFGLTDILFQGNRIKKDCTATVSCPSEGGTLDLSNLMIESVQTDTFINDWTDANFILQPTYLTNFKLKEVN